MSFFPRPGGVSFLLNKSKTKSNNSLPSLSLSLSVNNYGTVTKRSQLASTPSLPFTARDTCIDPFLSPLATREIASYAHTHAGHTRRTTTTLTQGYTTTDAFGTDGDDTAHSPIPDYDYPSFFQGLGGFPTNGSLPDVVDLIFIDYIDEDLLEYLATASTNYTYTEADISYYIDANFSTQTYLPLYVQSAASFQANLNNCSIY